MSSFVTSLFGSAQKPRKRYEFTQKAEGDTFANLEGDANKVNVTELLQDMPAEMIINNLSKESLMQVLNGDYNHTARARLSPMAVNGDTAAQEFMTKWNAVQDDSKSVLKTPLAQTPDKTRALRTSTRSSSGKKTARFRSNHGDTIEVDNDQSGNESEAEVPLRQRPKRTPSLTKTKVVVILSPAYEVQFESLKDSQKKDAKLHVDSTYGEWLKLIEQKDTEHAHIHNSTRDLDLFESKLRTFARDSQTGARFVMIPKMIAKYVETFMWKHKGFKPDELKRFEELIAKIQDYQSRHNLPKCHMTLEKTIVSTFE